MNFLRMVAFLIVASTVGPAFAVSSGMMQPNEVVVAQVSQPEGADAVPDDAPLAFERSQMTANPVPVPFPAGPTPRVPTLDESALFSTVAGKDPRGNEYYFTYRTPFELFLSLAVIATFLFFAIIYCIFINRAKRPSKFNRVFISMVATSAALLLVVAGFDEKQTAPVFGLLGAMLGYIFGRSDPVERPTSADVGKPQNAGKD